MMDEQDGKTDREIVEAFDQLFIESIFHESAEDAKNYLREIGKDPDELISRGLDRIKAARAQSPNYWRNRNQKIIENERKKLDQVSKLESLPVEKIQHYIDKLTDEITQQLGTQMPVQLYRNAGDLSDGDKLKYLQELWFWAHEQGVDLNLED